jgi:cobalamin biosynthetic protein CobC
LSYHGGNLGAAQRLFPDAPRPWIDLSTGVNPVPYPIAEIAPEQWARLPESERLAALEAVAAHRYGADAGAVIAAPGTQALIQLLPRLRPAARVGILGFSYSGYEQAWRAAGASVETVNEIATLAAFDVAIIVNPNNPDGRMTSRSDIAELHAPIAANRGMLIIDEAFMDLDTRRQSLIPVLPPSHTIVLRSFGKSYGLAGLRLGFAIASPDFVSPLRMALGPWAVSGPAIEIGRVALADDLWLDATRDRLSRDAGRLDRLLVDRGFDVLGGTTLFRLARRQDAPHVFGELMRKGILVRPFAALRDRLRFGMPAGFESWRRLELALRSI